MEERGIKISEKTIRHRLSVDFGLKSHRQAQKTCLTEAKKEAFGVCKKYLDWHSKMFSFQMKPQ